MMADNESDKNIETWKIKKLIKALEAARGNGNSMTSLIMHPCICNRQTDYVNWIVIQKNKKLNLSTHTTLFIFKSWGMLA